MSTLNFILRQDMASIFFPGEAPVTVQAEHPNFSRIVRVLQDACATAQEKITELRNLVSLKAMIPADDKLTIRGGKLFYRGRAVPEGVSKHFLQVVREAGDVRAIARFIMRMFDNPNPSSVEQLYEFVEANAMMITEDGCFLGYKAVRPNFMDKHSGTMSNRPGEVVSMSRAACDDRRDVTCSHGLHIAALAYARSFSGSNDPIVICKIDPKDVVSVPNDYDNQKMRVCRYEVMGVFDDKGTGAPIFEQTVITEADLQTDKLVGNTVAAGSTIEWSSNGVLRTGIVHSLVLADVSAYKMVKDADPDHGRLRFKDTETFHRVLIRSDLGWNMLALDRVEKKQAAANTPAPAVLAPEEIKPIVANETVVWSSIVGGQQHNFEGRVIRKIPAGKSALDATKVPMSQVKAGTLFRYQVRFDQDVHPHSDRLLIAAKREDGQTWYYAPLASKVRRKK